MARGKWKHKMDMFDKAREIQYKKRADIYGVLPEGSIVREMRLVGCERELTFKFLRG
jgi:hypothetical protein